MSPPDIASQCERLQMIVSELQGLPHVVETCREGKDTIERQAAEIERLRGTLRFYADEHECPSDGPWGVNSDDFGKRAQAALTGEDA